MTQHKHNDPIHFGLKYPPQTWTYGATLLDVSTNKRSNSNSTTYLSYLIV